MSVISYEKRAGVWTSDKLANSRRIGRSLQEVIGLTGQPRNLVVEIRRQLEAQIGNDRFELWFGAAHSISVRERILVVTADDSFSMDRIKTTYTSEINEIANQIGLDSVRFEAAAPESVTDQVSDPNSLQNHKVVKSDGDCKSFPADGEIRSEDSSSESKRPSQREGQSHSVSQSTKTEFNRPRHQKGRLVDFVVDPENEVVWQACQQVIRSPGDLTPFFLFGPAGCGKTHLLEGIAAEARRRSRTGKVQMVSAEQFTTDFVSSIKSRSMPMFRKRYRELDFLLVDDIQFFAGKHSTLVELQHTIDSVIKRGGQVILSADRSPNELEFAGPEFINRVNSGFTASVSPPGVDSRQRIIRQLAARRGTTLHPTAIDLMARELGGDVRLISGAINRVKIYQCVSGKQAPASEVRRYLIDLVQVSRRVVTMDDIEDAVCNLFGVDQRKLRSPTKVKAVSQPRMLAMWLSRKYTRAALSEIGDHFGGRSHSTVLSANSKVDQWLEHGESIGLKHSEFPVQVAIQRIENELRVG